MIHGDRIRLRAIEPDDLHRYVAWFNDPEVRRGMPNFLPMSMKDEETWYEQMLTRKPEERPLAIEILRGKVWTHIGGCGFIDVDQRVRSAEFGIFIGEKTLWDQGYGSDAVRTLLRHAFETLNLQRVQLRVYESNQRAIHVYRSLGFQEEGKLRRAHFHGGQYEDVLIMGLLHEEWLANEEGRD